MPMPDTRDTNIHGVISSNRGLDEESTDPIALFDTGIPVSKNYLEDILYYRTSGDASLLRKGNPYISNVDYDHYMGCYHIHIRLRDGYANPDSKLLAHIKYELEEIGPYFAVPFKDLIAISVHIENIQ
jgi:hypothetical protein